jgi:cell division protease FtsH
MTNKGNPPEKSQLLEERHPRRPSWIWFILLAVLLIYWIRFFPGGPTGEELSYTEFKRAVSEGRVAEVTMRGDRITGEYRPPQKDEQERADDEADNAPVPAPERFETVKPDIADPQLLALLEKNDVVIHARSEETGWFGLFVISMLPWLLIIGLFVFAARRMQQNMGGMGGGGGPGGLFGFGKSKAKRVEREMVNVTYNDVAGLENSKKELREIVLYLKQPEQFAQIGAELPKGMLLVGPPGVGKTLMARATAGEANVPFYSISGSEFIEMFVGVGASRVRDLFQRARQDSPAIIFVDELDSIGRVRGTGVGGGHDEREQTLNQILNEMDGFSPRESVIVLAASNRPDVLDPALTRPGRFDRRITLELPSKEARREILAIHTRKVPLTDDVNLDTLAQRTIGMSGADLKNLVNEAALLAARQKKKRVAGADFEAARDKILMGVEREEVVSDKEREVIAYHEAGHALVAKLIPDTDPLEKVTIIARGQALGATEQVPSEDRRNLNRNYLLGRVAVMMGGRVAEQVVFKVISTGGGNDLKRATQLVRRMVCEWGMSELGPVTFGGSEPHPFLGRQLTEQKDFSEHTARLIDEQVQQMLIAQEKTATQLIKDHLDHLHALAQALLDHEVVANEEVEEILDRTPVPSAASN